MDSVFHSLAQRIERVAMCTGSIKLHRLLLLDSVFHSIAQRIEHVAMCTKSIKLHRLLLLDSVLHSIAQRIDACSHLLLYQIHQTPPAAFDGFSTPQFSPANRACRHVYQIHQTPRLLLMDSVFHSLAQRIERVAMCTKSIKLHRLLLLDSVLHSIAQRIEHVAMCTKSIKLHRLLLLDSVLHSIAQRIELSPCVPDPSNSTGCFCWIQDCV